MIEQYTLLGWELHTLVCKWLLNKMDINIHYYQNSYMGDYVLQIKIRVKVSALRVAATIATSSCLFTILLQSFKRRLFAYYSHHHCEYWNIQFMISVCRYE